MSSTEQSLSPQERKGAAPPRLKAAEKYTDRLGRQYAYHAPKNPGNYSDDEATALLDLPEAMKQGNFRQAQTILEGDIGTKHERLTFDRLTALGELREAEMGVPTEDELLRSQAEASRTILTFELEGYPRNERSDLLKGMHGTIEERRKVINFIEDCISNLNAFPEDAEKMKQRDLLRIARDKLFAIYKDLVEFEAAEEARNERDQQESVSQTKRAEEATKVRQEIAGIYEEQDAPITERVASQPKEPPQPAGENPTLKSAVESPALNQGMSPQDREAYFREARERRARRAAAREAETHQQAASAEVEEARMAVEEALAEQADHQPDNVTERETVSDDEDEQAPTNNERTSSKEEDERQKRAALNRGLSIINTIPPQAQQYLFRRYNPTGFQKPLQEIQQSVDLDKLDIELIAQLNQNLTRIGMPNPRSPIWQEIGKPPRSEVGNLAQQIEQAFVPFLKHLQDISQK